MSWFACRLRVIRVLHPARASVDRQVESFREEECSQHRSEQPSYRMGEPICKQRERVMRVLQPSRASVEVRQFFDRLSVSCLVQGGR